MTALASSIRRILGVHNESYTSVRRDGSVILIDAHDPVLASAAAGLLFGVDRTLIARRVDNNFDHIVNAISEVGGNLLLAGDRFLVRVEGRSRGFLPRDVEMAATSTIIEKRSSLEVRPGTAENHDRLLYAYLTGKSAYISLFADDCLGGLPPGVQGGAVCCIFDAVSALNCLETMRMGFDTHILVCYTKESQRIPLARMLSRIVPRMAKKRIDVNVIRMDPGGRNYMDKVALTTGILLEEARKINARHVSIPVSHMLFDSGAVDKLASHIYGAGLVPVMPLAADGRLYKMLGELNISGSGPIDSVICKRYDIPALPADIQHQDINYTRFAINAGPNALHDILDTKW